MGSVLNFLGGTVVVLAMLKFHGDLTATYAAIVVIGLAAAATLRHFTEA